MSTLDLCSVGLMPALFRVNSHLPEVCNLCGVDLRPAPFGVCSVGQGFGTWIPGPAAGLLPGLENVNRVCLP
jgi:hypothetical protein